MGPDPITVPEGLARSVARYFGPEWAEALPELTADQCDRWGLRPVGQSMHGAVALVVPVESADGTPAVLKVQPVDEETAGEPAALAAWGGEGAVRLLRHDPQTGAMLLEALDASRSLEHVEVERALTVIGGLLARLSALPAPAGMRGLEAVTQDLATQAGTVLDRLAPGRDRELVADLAARAHELAEDPGDRLLHWDLHYGNVLAPGRGSDRDRWLAIDPKPLSGDPGFELLPALHNRWQEAVASGDPRRAIRRRFDVLTGAADLERDRARAWTLVRVLQACVWAFQDGAETVPEQYRLIAEAVDGSRR